MRILVWWRHRSNGGNFARAHTFKPRIFFCCVSGVWGANIQQVNDLPMIFIRFFQQFFFLFKLFFYLFIYFNPRRQFTVERNDNDTLMMMMTIMLIW